MSEMRVVPIEMHGAWPLIRPIDQQLHDLAVKYIQENFSDPKPRLVDFSGTNAHVAVVCEFDGDEPKEVVAIAGLQYRPDFPVWRMTGDRAKQSFVLMWRYWRDYMVSRGWRGADVMISADENAPEGTRCPNMTESLKQAEATPAHRWFVKVR